MHHLLHWYRSTVGDVLKPVNLYTDVSDGSNLSSSSVKYAAAINKNVGRGGDDSVSNQSLIQSPNA